MSNGRFVWHELVTTDKQKAIAFYTELLNWKTDVMRDGGFEYTVIKAGKEGIGGIDRPQASGVPSHWVGYCTTTDVDGLLEKAKKLGGKALVPATNIPPGRFAILQDPQGAVIAPMALREEAPESDAKPAVGTFCWNELMTDDVTAASEFYSQIFGWKPKAAEGMGEMQYTIFNRGEKMAAGLMKKPMPQLPNHWLHYVAVDNVDQTTARAAKLGAKTLVTGTDIPNIGRFSVIQDPTGAVVALFQGQ
jgi:predicted enzyme related to lactoylglutathione lyase